MLLLVYKSKNSFIPVIATKKSINNIQKLIQSKVVIVIYFKCFLYFSSRGWKVKRLDFEFFHEDSGIKWPLTNK